MFSLWRPSRDTGCACLLETNCVRRVATTEDIENEQRHSAVFDTKARSTHEQRVVDLASENLLFFLNEHEKTSRPKTEESTEGAQSCCFPFSLSKSSHEGGCNVREGLRTAFRDCLESALEVTPPLTGVQRHTEICPACFGACLLRLLTGFAAELFLFPFLTPSRLTPKITTSISVSGISLSSLTLLKILIKRSVPSRDWLIKVRIFADNSDILKGFLVSSCRKKPGESTHHVEWTAAMIPSFCFYFHTSVRKSVLKEHA